jgi:hypothetical protein
MATEGSTELRTVVDVDTDVLESDSLYPHLGFVLGSLLPYRALALWMACRLISMSVRALCALRRMMLILVVMCGSHGVHTHLGSVRTRREEDDNINRSSDDDDISKSLRYSKRCNSYSRGDNF